MQMQLYKFMFTLMVDSLQQKNAEDKGLNGVYWLNRVTWPFYQRLLHYNDDEHAKWKYGIR